MSKRLWIEDTENYQEMFYILKKKLSYYKYWCLEKCRFSYFKKGERYCSLFEDDDSENGLLGYDRQGYIRCEKCFEIFGE